MNIGAFAIVVSVANQSEDRMSIESYAGLGRSKPVMCVLMTVFLLSLAGFPGTAGFIAKYNLLLGAAESGLWVLSVVLVLTTVVSYWYYLRVAWYMWMKDAPDEAAAGGPAHALTPFATHVVLFLSVGLILLGGIFPGALLEMAADSVAGLRDFMAGAAAGS